MKRVFAAVIAFSTIATSSHAQESEPLVFKPQGGWTGDVGEDYCRVARDFSNGTDRISFAVERMQPNSFVKIILVGDGIKLYRRADMIGYHYLPSGGSRTTQLLRSESGDGQQLLIISGANIGPDLAALFGAGRGAGGPPPGGAAPAGPPPAPGTPFYNTRLEADYAAGITGIGLTEGTLSPVRIETGSLKNVITLLQDCSYDLLDYWGLDKDKHRTISREVVPEPGTFTLPGGTIGFGDFGKLSGGTNQVRVMVDAAGKPSACHIHSPTLDDTTNRRICNFLMENAKFQPALDAGGQPMASYWITSPFGLLGGPGPRT